ncbi:MAG: site-specific DNA-methyltransferase [Candidatus Lokiarchaeota archaeon]|nr:site-specific DNA-methyltransferase [Candidatus Lokiarchaeota archaeon]
MIIDDQCVYFSSSERMNELSNNIIDIVITSPPYNRGKNYSVSVNSEEGYNDALPEKDYLNFLERVWGECYRVASESAVFFLNIGDSANNQGISEKVVKTAVSAGWKRIQDIVWIKSIYGRGHYTPSGSIRRFNNVWEHIYLLVKNKRKYRLNTKAVGIPYADKSNIGRYGDTDLRDPGNVFHIEYEKTTGNTIKKGHDAPFPIGLPYICIKAVPKANTILDPFLGTGTTLAASSCLGKKGFGYELYPRKDLIINTIQAGKNYSPKPVVLIPHYEITIKNLVSLIEDSLSKISITTKKEFLEYKITLESLEKLGIDSPLVGTLTQLLKQNN